MRNRLFIPLLATAALIAGCHKAPKPVAFSAAFHTLPLPPDGQVLDRQGGTEAMQMLVVTPAAPDSVLAYYRKVLSADPFHLVNEQRTGKSVALYAEQDGGPPIWVTVGPNGNVGSQVMIAGARDSTLRDTVTRQVTTADSGGAVPLPVKKP